MFFKDSQENPLDRRPFTRLFYRKGHESLFRTWIRSEWVGRGILFSSWIHEQYVKKGIFTCIDG